MRRALLLLLFVTGCPLTSNTGGECQVDRDCGDNICARDGICHAPSEIRAVRAEWTIRGQDANSTSCAGHADLYIAFQAAETGDHIGFSPVPCVIGQYSIDKLP